jgi:hypothetical protein
VFLGGLIPNKTNTARQRNMAQWQSKKQVSDSFRCATKTTSLTTIPNPFSKIVLCQYHPLLQEPKKNLNLQRHLRSREGPFIMVEGTRLGLTRWRNKMAQQSATHRTSYVALY